MTPTIADAPFPKQPFLYDYGTTFHSSKTRSFVLNKLQAYHSPKTAQIRKTTANLGKDGLGARPADLLLANGIVWLEGPSDRIYFNRWIELRSDGALREGRDYQCAFYGGSLLGRTQFASPEAADAELTNLLQVNPNPDYSGGFGFW